ncbi:MAG: NAD(P)/FAD-dependent oxidoreductase [Proteobacteria bacterium]|nr:NAD(P)/FAD-dependent oxidoreductase [Pseudomonadota bacterium]
MTSGSDPSRRFSRRQALSLGAAGAVTPALAYAAPASDTDVVIVGAGAAGIAAAHALRAAGVEHVLIEAGNRIGGRAWTESVTFGVPFDHGAHWVQNQWRNPHFARGEQSGYRFYPARDDYRIFADGTEATSGEVDALWRTWENVEEAISQAGDNGWDVSPASVAPDGGTWTRTAWYYIGPWEMGKDMDAFSCVDWWNSADSVDWYCAAGYGTLVADHGAGLPVSLDTAASAIRWDGPGVAVETNRGTIRARAVIVTVSTGVLASGAIAFQPGLPQETLEAFHGISMGDYNHIALRFSQDIFAMGEDGYLFHRVDDSMEAFGALTNASGTGIAYCDVGGSFARDLEQAGQDAAIDFVMERLRGMLGSEVDRTFLGGTATAWTSDPLFRGCYASALPGAWPLRRVLREPVGERIFFAGEACHPEMWATVGGADLSGSQVAATVIDTLA